MKPLSFRALVVLATAGAWGACAEGSVTGGSSGPVLAAPAADAQVFGRAPEFTLTSQSGEQVTLQHFEGEPFAVAAIFTRCSGPCPRITAALRGLQEELTGSNVRLVTVSVDPSYDTPEVLTAYAASYTVDLERWTFLTGDEADVQAFLKDGLWLPLARAENPELAPGERITHSTKIVAVDGRGRLRGWYDGLRSDELEALRARLLFLDRE